MAKDSLSDIGNLPKVILVVALIIFIFTNETYPAVQKIKEFILGNLLLVLIGIIIYLVWRAKNK